MDLTIFKEGIPLRKQIFGCGLLIGFMLVFPPQAKTEQAKAGEPTISLDVTEAYLEDVLKIFSKQSGFNFVASDDTQGKKVTMYLDQVPLQAALLTMLEANHLTLRSVAGKNLYVIADSGAPKVSTVTKVFRLKYARVVPTKGDISKTFGLTGSLITSTFTGSTGTSGGTTSSAAPAGGGSEAQGGEGGIVPIIRSLLTPQGSVISDPRTNSLIVTDIPQRVEVIQETIKSLDIKQMQLYIEAEVIEVTLDTLRRLGLEYGDSTGTVGSYIGPKRTSFFPFATGLLDGATHTNTLGTLSFSEANILFKLLATEKDVKFLARPRLLTLSNEVAEIRIVADAVTGVTSSSQATTGTITETIERNTVGTVLRVTPLVNEDRYVTMVIEPEVSRVVQSSSFTKFLDPNRRAARTTVMVQDGSTIMIAGLISSESSQSSRRIPGLGDLPLLGLPFKRTETQRSNTEIIIFITPHVLGDDPQTLIAEEREQTPISIQEQRFMQTHHQRILKERAIVETIENVMR